MGDSVITRWGIIGPGNIARTFAQNLFHHREVDSTNANITHVITAVASSSSTTNAQTFIDQNVKPYQPSGRCTAYGSYKSLVQSADVDVVYIATPHSSHYRNAMLVLTNGKNVLCEKPLCVNAAQARVLRDTARERGLFLMEALWTRFLPISLYVKSSIRQGKIGDVIRVSADFSMGCGDQKGFEEMFGGSEDRIVNPELAGGVLLDLGIYSLSWIFMSVYHLLPWHLKRPPILAGATMTPFAAPTDDNRPLTQSWTDATTTLLLTLPSAPSGTTVCHAVATTSLYSNTDPGYGGDDPNSPEMHAFSTPSARIQGTHGEIQIFGPLPRPQRIRIFSKVLSDVPNTEGGRRIVPGQIVNAPGTQGYHVKDKIFESMGDGNGMFHEVDEVARCLAQSKLESDIMPLEETIEVLRIMDEVRYRCGLRYNEIEGLG